MHTILFVAIDDSSDIRVRKEIATLQKRSHVYFYGLSPDKRGSKAKCTQSIVIGHSYKNPFWLLVFVIFYIYLIFRKRYISIHIVDEQLFLLLWPVNALVKLFKYSSICLDVFDSILLKNNIIPRQLPLFLSRLFYYPLSSIVLTDNRRLSLYPDFLLDCSCILPNKPNIHGFTSSKTRLSYGDQITISYIGTLAQDRGSLLLKNILDLDQRFRVISAGLVFDSYTEKLICQYHHNWSHFGNLPSDLLMKLLSEHADFILLYYSPSSINNIFASPNKLWDAISLSIPVICNDLTMVSVDVLIRECGLIFSESALDSLYELAFESYSQFFKNQASKNYASSSDWWEYFQSELYKAHSIDPS
jgi:hypothetical protein